MSSCFSAGKRGSSRLWCHDRGSVLLIRRLVLFRIVTTVIFGAFAGRIAMRRLLKWRIRCRLRCKGLWNILGRCFCRPSSW